MLIIVTLILCLLMYIEANNPSWLDIQLIFITKMAMIYIALRPIFIDV